MFHDTLLFCDLYYTIDCSCSLTFSGEFNGEDGSALFEGSRLSIRCLNVYLNAVKDGLAKRKIHPLRGIKLMVGIASIQGT